MTVPATLTFTKLVVDDLDAMIAFYCHVFGLHPATRARFEKSSLGEPIEEISLAANAGDDFGALSLLTYEGQPPPPTGEVMLGFTTGDLDALLGRAVDAGGAQVGELSEYDDPKIRVAFIRDPEGHLCELVELRS